MPRPSRTDASIDRAHARAARQRLSRSAIERIALQFVTADHRLVVQRVSGRITETEWVHAAWALHFRTIELRSEFDRARLLRAIHRLTRRARRRR